MKIRRSSMVMLIAILFSNLMLAQSLGFNNNRIAISADGNNQPDTKPDDWETFSDRRFFATADPDDWGGTPAALAMIAKAGLQNKLVHFSYNNFVGSPKHTSAPNYMDMGVKGAIARWNYDGRRFFDVTDFNKNKGETINQGAINHLANQIKISTAANPLYFIHMGPSEFFYRAVKQVVDGGNIGALSHVQVISHSGYNDNHLRRKNHHTMDQTIALSGNRIKFEKIRDQNACDNKDRLWCSEKDYSPYAWMQESSNKNLNWLYTTLTYDTTKSKADISDAGMVWYLLRGDDLGNPQKLQNFIGNNVVTPDNYTGCIIEETDGLLVFEAERMELASNWKIGTDTAKASGGKFIFYEGSNSFAKVNGADYCFYTFRINNPGGYTFKWTMRQPEGERGSDLGNDAWFYFSNDTAKAFAGTQTLTQYYKFVGRSDDNFTQNGSVEVNHKQSWVSVSFPEAGEYTLKIAGRSHHFEVDRFILSRNRSQEVVASEIATLAESSECNISTPVDETISIATVPASFDDTMLSVPVSVNYTANETRVINVAITEADGTFIKNQRATVQAGSGTANLNVSLDNPLTGGNSYRAVASLRKQPGNYNDNVIPSVSETFSVTSSITADDIAITNAPTVITATNNMVAISYAAIASRDIFLQLRRGSDVIDFAKTTVARGTGNASLSLNLENLPESASDYFWRVIIRPEGADWQENIKVVQIDNVEVINNLVQNFGFETGNLNAWNSNNTVNPIQVVSDANSGNYAANLTGRNGINQLITVKPNTSYTLKANAKVLGGQFAAIGVKNYGGAEKSTRVTSTNYSESSITFTTGNQTTASIYFYVHVVGTSAWVDDFSVVENPVASKDLALSENVDITVYPNPFIETVTITLPSDHSCDTILIYDLQGKTVYSGSITDETSIELNDFATNALSGIYILQVSGADSAQTFNLIKK